MKLDDIAKARAEAERMAKASDMLALVGRGPMRLTVGQVEIVLTEAGQQHLKSLAKKTLLADLEDAARKLRALGVDLGDTPPSEDPTPSAPAAAMASN